MLACSGAARRASSTVAGVRGSIDAVAAGAGAGTLTVGRVTAAKTGVPRGALYGAAAVAAVAGWFYHNSLTTTARLAVLNALEDGSAVSPREMRLLRERNPRMTCVRASAHQLLFFCYCPPPPRYPPPRLVSHATLALHAARPHSKSCLRPATSLLRRPGAAAALAWSSL
jgi:hypothetical protein